METADTQQIQKILGERARELARTVDEDASDTVRYSTIIVTCGDETFALPTGQLREIVEDPGIVPLPGLPAWLSGVTQIRGEIVAVVQLSAWFSLEHRNAGKLLAIVEHGQNVLAIRVEAVQGFRAIVDSEITSESDNDAASGRPLLNITTDGASVIDLAGLIAKCRNELTLLEVQP